MRIAQAGSVKAAVPSAYSSPIAPGHVIAIRVVRISSFLSCTKDALGGVARAGVDVPRHHGPRECRIEDYGDGDANQEFCHAFPSIPVSAVDGQLAQIVAVEGDDIEGVQLELSHRTCWNT